jgi:hypothetical protein
MKMKKNYKIILAISALALVAFLLSGSSLYNFKQKPSYAILASGSATINCQFPQDRPKGSYTFYIKVACSGSPALTVEYEPIVVTSRQPNIADTLASTAYSVPTGCTYKTAQIYLCGTGSQAFTAVTVANGAIYMVYVDMDGHEWDGIKFRFTETAAVAVTVTPYFANG